MLDFKEIISAFLVLFAIIDITGSIPIFLSLKQSGNRFNPIYAALISLLIFVVLKYSNTRQTTQTIPKIREAAVIELPAIPMIHVVT